MLGFVSPLPPHLARGRRSRSPYAPRFRPGGAMHLRASNAFSSHQPVHSAPETLLRQSDTSAHVHSKPVGAIDGVPPVDPTMRARFEAMIRAGQNDICAALEQLDGSGKRFREDAWVRGSDSGGGISRVLQDGDVFEKAGVNVSVVYGTMPPEALRAATADSAVARNAGYAPDERVPFFAAGISSVLHPWNPHAPTMHFNYRYFETDRGMWWMGGGTDLTPAYLYEEDARHFHGTLKQVCDRHDPAFYPRFKKWCDDYFLIRHRGERRQPRHGAARHRGLLPDRGAAEAHGLHRGTEAVATSAARAVCGIQFGIRPGHRVWPQNWRAHREHSRLAAADSKMGVRFRSSAGHAGGRPPRRVQTSARLARL
eukprot:ctg_282.g115